MGTNREVEYDYCLELLRLLLELDDTFRPVCQPIKPILH